MFKLLIVIACKAGLTSQVIDFETDQARDDAAAEIWKAAPRLGEVEIVFL